MKLTNSSFFLNPVNTTTVPTMACVYIGLLILGNESFFSANCRSAVGPNILQHVKLKQPKSDSFNYVLIYQEVHDGQLRRTYVHFYEEHHIQVPQIFSI